MGIRKKRSLTNVSYIRADIRLRVRKEMLTHPSHDFHIEEFKYHKGRDMQT